MKLLLVSVLLLLTTCKRAVENVPDAGPPRVVRAQWPADLMRDVTQVRISHGVETAVVRLSKEPGGGRPAVWLMDSPFVGDADPDAIDRLRFILTTPQLVEALPPPPTPVAFRIELTGATTTTLTSFEAALGAPIPVEISGVGRFLVSPTEFSNKVPLPTSFAASGLWVDANNHAQRLTVKSRSRPGYELALEKGEWRVVKGNTATRRELDDFIGVIVGRQAIGHSSAAPATLGLEPPAATATLCIDTGRCRDFLFGLVAVDGGPTRYFAQTAGSAALELRDNDWRLLVTGP